MTQISVLLPTFNCASIIEHTLKSVTWADEILVVDSFSSDDTIAICRQYGACIIQHEYINSAKQKNWAVGQCRHPWVFQIDADEIPEAELVAEISKTLEQVPEQVHAYQIPRKNHILGQWVRYGGIYPDYQTRLFRRDYGRWLEREVHAHIQVPGEIRQLKNHILHYGMPHLSNQLRNLDRYTRYEADEAVKQGQTFFWPNLFLRPIGVFLYRYFWLQGFRAGWRGFFLASYLATYKFWEQAKLWEMQTLNLRQSPK